MYGRVSGYEILFAVLSLSLNHRLWKHYLTAYMLEEILSFHQRGQYCFYRKKQKKKPTCWIMLYIDFIHLCQYQLKLPWRITLMMSCVNKINIHSHVFKLKSFIEYTDNFFFYIPWINKSLPNIKYWRGFKVLYRLTKCNREKGSDVIILIICTLEIWKGIWTLLDMWLICCIKKKE